ncbi:MAG: hypothetical protein JWO95_3485 [Verrucomicrobiales bacterium]|nr:hypothetical protein [Verrucomicrobiales bacterium]
MALLWTQRNRLYRPLLRSIFRRGNARDEASGFAAGGGVGGERLRGHEFSCAADDGVPLKRGAGVLFVELHVVVAENALVDIVLLCGEDVWD